jgi:hypothetical protein
MIEDGLIIAEEKILTIILIRSDYFGFRQKRFFGS